MFSFLNKRSKKTIPEINSEMSSEDKSPKVLCDTWVTAYEELIQELQSSRECKDEKDNEKWHRGTLLKRITNLLRSTWPLSAGPKKEVSMLPTANSNITRSMNKTVFQPREYLSVYDIGSGIAFWKAVVIRNNTGTLWEGTTCDTLMISYGKGADGWEQDSIRIGNFYETIASAPFIPHLPVQASSFDDQKILQYVFVPDTKSTPVYLWTEDGVLTMKLWYEEKQPYLGLPCKIDFLNYGLNEDLYTEYRTFLEEYKLPTSDMTDNSSWKNTAFQNENFLLFLYKNPKWTKHLVNRFEPVRNLTYAFTVDCWHGYGFNQLTMKDVHTHQERLVSHAANTGRSMLFLLCPRPEKLTPFMAGVECDYLHDRRSPFSSYYNMVIYNLKEQKMLQMINANDDGVYKYESFPWIQNKRKAEDELDTSSVLKQQKIS